VRGPYCHVRNPMITGVILLLMAESLTFGSWQRGVPPMFEDPGLIKRFGGDYLVYMKHVPR